LFEAGAEARVDVTVVVSAPADQQRQRALARPGMSPEKFDQLLRRQMPDAEKQARADFVVDSSVSLEDMQNQIDKILDSLRGREGRVMERLRHT
jgi:dephospho-CoA kinase